MNTSDLKCLINDVNEKLKPLLKRKADLESKLRESESLDFILINKITKDDVQRCDDDGMPWMGNINAFGKWIDNHSDKPWCCWNGALYLSSEIVAGRMVMNAPGRYSNLDR